ncbi:MAG TPA: cupin domain-containing protein [Bryobacteraceae bacterium]|nr:cupin domain-containing protein [Bryobacteraceae bacterium]
MNTEYYTRLGARNTAPLWEVLRDIVPARPRASSVPAFWCYEELRPLLLEAGGLITAEEAERRVLILENPAARGHSRTTSSLYAGLQLVMPGEVAHTHRHVASALRFVLESDGGYTTVDGERLNMHPGDFILTPSWCWHAHGNPSDKPVVWLDGLDIPLVNLFETSFFERYTGENAVSTRPAQLIYPYSRSREALEQAFRTSPPHPCYGVRMQLAELPTIAAFLQLLPAGFEGVPFRSTDGTVFCAVEGEGISRVGDATFAWKRHDVFVAPSWCPVSHSAARESVLFSFSDRPAQKALGLWRAECPMI